ncbi:lipoprotein [Streptomyces sp. GC420]|uniref:lipoprotein n=1 Tax=Streptomyces sp. GC420 TaxID=2697568 RepID=UPI0014153156|nr:lipoprotein [Streptomyces sp. GC420]NBM17120.1 hypothetical protein [Streptomyces sp. GC420]
MRARYAVRGAAGTAALIGVLTACSSSSETGADPKPSGTKGTSAAAEATDTAAARGGSIGGSGSPCELPVTFGLAKSWKAEAVDTDPDSELGEILLRQGSVTLVCEIDAKPAGNIGFLRVWTGERTDDSPRDVLEAFLGDETGISKEKYSEFTAGDLVGAEVVYLSTADEPKQETALAVTTPTGPVVLHLGGLDTEEHKEMLPAFELAKRTLRVG